MQQADPRSIGERKLRRSFAYAFGFQTNDSGKKVDLLDAGLW
jgi:hypothetical protein